MGGSNQTGAQQTTPLPGSALWEACSLGPPEHPQQGPQGSEKPGSSSTSPHGGSLPPTHLVGLGWGHQQTRDHRHQTQQLHASQAWGGRQDCTPGKEIRKQRRGGWPRGTLSPKPPRSGAGKRWELGPGSRAFLARSAKTTSIYPRPRAPTAHMERPAAGPPGRGHGPWVPETSLRPPPRVPPPSAIAARSSSSSGLGELRARSPGTSTPPPGRDGSQSPRDPQDPCTPPPTQVANLRSPPQRHKTRLAPPLPLLLVAGAAAQRYLVVAKATRPASARALRLRAREREVFLNPTRREKGASAKRAKNR